MPGEKARYQMCACVQDQCSLVCAHLAFFFWWPEGLQVKNEESTSQYEQVYSVGFLCLQL